MFRLIFSSADNGVNEQELGEFSSFEEAVKYAKKHGARGVPEERGYETWCFSGGRHGYWIEAL
jgi:hypothetical protein